MVSNRLLTSEHTWIRWLPSESPNLRLSPLHDIARGRDHNRVAGNNMASSRYCFCSYRVTQIQSRIPSGGPRRNCWDLVDPTCDFSLPGLDYSDRFNICTDCRGCSTDSLCYSRSYSDNGRRSLYFANRIYGSLFSIHRLFVDSPLQ